MAIPIFNDCGTCPQLPRNREHCRIEYYYKDLVSETAPARLAAFLKNHF